MFRCDARGHVEANGMWAPEDGRGAMGGPWAARVQADEGAAGRASPGKSWFVVPSRGGGTGLGGLDTELFSDDDLESVASY
ncbi:hypothetical protein ACLESD_06620 [Pyxidicoccus sp. 3LFB2]